MSKAEIFLRLLQRAGATIGRREGTRVVGVGDRIDVEELEELLEVSQPAATPESEWREGKPLEVIVLGRGGIRHHHGGEAVSKKQDAEPKGPDADGREAPKDEAERLRRRINKLKREIARMEVRPCHHSDGIILTSVPFMCFAMSSKKIILKWAEIINTFIIHGRHASIKKYLLQF